MSVLIKGMQMPTEVGTIVVYKSSGKFFAARAGRDELFPIAPVPEHGRLVDVDALIKRLEQQRAKVLSRLQEAHRREEGYTREDYIFERNGDMISILRNQAVVIPAEKMI